jgi:hypothetical protein
VERRGLVGDTFPHALYFPEKRIVTRGNWQGNFFDYEAKQNEFKVKFIASTEIETTELPFLINVIPPRKVRIEKIVRFKAVNDFTPTIQSSGLLLRPKEQLHLEGRQSQEAVYAATSEGTTTLKVFEITKEGK